MRNIRIIGAGIIGLATAWRLTEAGVKVSIIDPDPVSGASHHAAGMLAPTAEMQYQQEALYPLMFESATMYKELVDSVAKYTDKPTGYLECGSYVIGGDAADNEHVNELLNLQHRYGRRAEHISVSKLREIEPALSPTIAGAVSVPDDHQINPRLFTAAMIDALEKRGVVIERRASTPDDLGPDTVLASGLGAKDMLPQLKLRAVWGDMIRMTIPEPLRPILSSVVGGFVHDRPVYLVPRAKETGELVLGATSREDDRDIPKVGGVLDLLRDAASVLPGIQECSITEVTAGGRPGTPDDLPFIGIDPKTHTTISTGYFRHGILLTALGSSLTTKLVLEQELTEKEKGFLESCDPARF